MKTLNTIIASAVLTSTSTAALLYSVSTDATGTFTSGGWTDSVGTATVEASAGTGNPTGAKMLTGLTAGTLDLGTVTQWGSPALPAGTTATMDITLNNGTADLYLTHNPSLNTKNFQLQNLSGATSLTVEINLSTPLAANFTGVATGYNPYLMAMRALSTETHSVTATFLGLIHTTDGVSFNNGLPTGAEGVDMNGSENDWGTDGASSSWTVDNNNVWQGLNGFDTVGPVDGDDPLNNYTLQNTGDSVLQDSEAVYASGMRYVITRTDGQAFDSGSQFLFSTGGAQWPDTVDLPVSVPEPSSTLLVSFAGILLLLRRSK